MGIYKTGVYNQRLTENIPFDGKILSVAINKAGELYACTETGLCRLKNEKWQNLSENVAFSIVHACADGRIIAAAGNSVYTITDKGAALLGTFEDEVTAIDDDDKLYVLTKRVLYVEREDGFYHLSNMEQESFCLSTSKGRVCAANGRCIQRMEGKRRSWRCIFPDHSTMPRITINDIVFDKIGNLLVGADEGLFIYDYKDGWYSYKQIKALPREKIYSLAVMEDGSILAGTDAGAVLIRNGLQKYLPAEKYAFCKDVELVAAHGTDIYTISKGGIVKISEKPMTLMDKAVHLYEETEKYFPRKEGYVTSIDGDIEPGKVSSISDNDGLWTHSYLTALCLWYSVTKDKKILESARRYKDAMLVLTRAPEIKGFTARAVRYPDEEGWGEGLDTLEIGAEWHRSSDGTYEWLGETSSDEMTGHYVGFATYYDLCATKKEKAEICEAVCNITDHIMESGGYLLDFDGKPTTWACWDENALNNDSMWMWEKGVNSLEMLNFLKISYHMSGDEKYLNKYNSLINDHHFLINAAYHKREDGHTCHIDDNLAMLNTFSLLRLEKDPAIRQYLLLGLSSHYEYEKIESNPYYGFIYKGFIGAPCDVDTMVKHLQDYPYEISRYAMYNSSRRGLEFDDEPVYWGEEPRIKTPLAWDERPYSRLGLNPFGIDGERHGTENGMSYLLIYWLGRFLEIIE